MATKEASQNTNGWLRTRSRRDRRVRRTRRQADSGLPDWNDLSDDPTADPAEGGISTIRFAFIVAALAAGVALYVGHVHATKAVRADLQEVRSENRQLHQRLRQLKSEYYQRTAPAVIFERARKIGLREGPAYGPNVYLRNPEN